MGGTIEQKKQSVESYINLLRTESNDTHFFKNMMLCMKHFDPEQKMYYMGNSFFSFTKEDIMKRKGNVIMFLELPGSGQTITGDYHSGLLIKLFKFKMVRKKAWITTPLGIRHYKQLRQQNSAALTSCHIQLIHQI